MKQFIPHAGSNVDGALLSDSDVPRAAIFLTPMQAKLIALSPVSSVQSTNVPAFPETGAGA